ncbi:single-stranded DNA-binding protein [Arthrobacter sp. ok362]|uniref:single-stranded DNA-binding protein n=1 Tax=Arthrobacter sp. ok362 TaxID=1761745 RepID=UPI00088FE20F|nr:single-stranded DNA-binding protein [Arthrobacter sp. ok362]SDK80402.1 single-strand DNA-binding protein [Arthrobacter sp. ok362]
MSGETFVTIIGKVHDDPECKFNPSGSAVTKFTVVSNPRKFNKQTNEWENKPGKFWDCRAWNAGRMLLAENVANHLKKGDNVILYGEIETQVWEAEDGKKRRSDQLRVEAIGKDFRWHQAYSNDVPAATTTDGGWGNTQNSQNTQPFTGGWGNEPSQGGWGP